MANLEKLDSIISRAKLYRAHNQAGVLDFAALDLIEALATELRSVILSFEATRTNA